MKKILQVLAVVSVLIACSDFFPRKTIQIGGGGSNEKTGPALPEKAEQDERACDFGEVSGDVGQKFVWDLATKTLCPKVRELRYYVTAMRLAARQLALEPDSARLDGDLQHLFYGAMNAFEFLVANPMEPLRAVNSRIEMGLYSWPNFNKFALNPEVLKAAQQKSAYVMRLAPSRKGLAVIEHLIFSPEMILSAGATGALTPAEAAFNALPREERRAARLVLLSRMLDDVGGLTEDLYNEWSATQKAYPRDMLARFSNGARPMILNEISDGLFYLEKVKDYKLGQPLAQNARCRGDRCPDDVENLASGASIESMRANYDAFRAAMVGSPGFLDLVTAVGRGDLATSMRSMIDGIGATLADVEKGPSLRDQVVGMDKAACLDALSAQAICRLYFQWKEFSAVYRSDFTSALNLQPPRTEADND